ncbi:MAG: nicotinate-nucleotide--dimethylbenzimidazole phosphoribosyltransferase, partial [Nocardiopsis sp. BM-2018]
DAPPDEVVGLGSGADSAMLRRKQDVVAAALQRWASSRHDPDDHIALLAALGGPEFALLCGVVTGVSSVGGIVVLDGAATTVAAAVAARADPVVCSHLVAGQRSNEVVHVRLLAQLGLEPLLDLRLRAGEGLGAVMATRLVLDSLEVRRRTVTTE